MDPMRLILIAAAGYLLYNWYQGQTLTLPGVPTTTVPPTTTTPPATTTPILPGTPPGTQQTSPPASTVPTNTAYLFYTDLWNEVPSAVSQLGRADLSGRDWVLALAAGGDPDAMALVTSRGVLLAVDQWNVYRELRGSSPVDPSYMPALLGGDGVTRTNITASDYHNRILSAGLSGLGAIWA